MKALRYVPGILLASMLVLGVPYRSSAQEDSSLTVDRVVNLEALNGKRTIVLKWSTDPPQPDAIFEIWRKKEGDRSMERIASGLTLPCYEDREVVTRTSYIYRLKWEVPGEEKGTSNTVAVALAARNPFALAYPGMYQVRSRQKGKGGLILTAGTVSLLATAGSGGWYLWSRNQARELGDAYRSRPTDRGATQSLKTVYLDWVDAHDRESTSRTALYISAGTFGALYLWHLFDVLVFPRDKACGGSTVVPGIGSVHPYLGIDPCAYGDAPRYITGVSIDLYRKPGLTQ